MGEKRVDGTWRFKRKYADQTPLMLDEPPIESSSEWLETWEDALADLDARGWARLPGVHVHPDFASAVWEAISDRLRDRKDHYAVSMLKRWQACCRRSSGSTDP